MKKVEITLDFNKKIGVEFSGGAFTHRDIKNMKRALGVNFRYYHYNLIHPKKKVEMKEPLTVI